ncbi:MAG: hypothetical protein ABR573_04690 [Candidatus Dormibacteria bacterium]
MLKVRPLLAVVAMAGFFLSATGAKAAGNVRVLTGGTYKTAIFPNNFLTVADSAQVTGLRVNFVKGRDYPNCDSTNYSICDAFAELNTQDGFDINPRVVVPLSGDIQLGSVKYANFYITDAGGTPVSGMRQLTFDPATHTLAGISDKFLLESTLYHVRVTSGILDSSGAPIDACGGTCDVAFTTRTASAQLVNMRAALDSGVAYAQAGMTAPADRQASFTQNGTNDVFRADQVPATGIQRNDNASVDPNYKVSSTVLNTVAPGSAGYYAFGSFKSPRYQYRSIDLHHDNAYGTGDSLTDGEVPQVPTKSTPRAFGADTLGLIVITPNPVLFPPPWPAAIYGPGFTRSDFDIFLTADYNASLGIATLATEPAGHGYGPSSSVTVTTLPTNSSTTFLSYGRGRDLDGNGCIDDGLEDGVGPTDHKSGVTGGCAPNQTVAAQDLPSHKPIDGVQSGLVQTVVDNMALVRSIEAGMTIPGAGDLSGTTPGTLKRTGVMYYGLSFGGIYGTMLMGVDPHVHQGLLNDGGGPIVDIARESHFRNNIAATLKVARPNYLNGGPGLEGFTEDLPLRNEAPVVISHPGAAAIQELFGNTNWFNRGGSPETFAPRIRLRPDPAWATDPKNVVFLNAYADGTVPNPTAGNIQRAGELFDRVVYYRNDKTPTYQTNPHGWLEDPRLTGNMFGEQLLGAFLATGQVVNTNPAILEYPIADPNNLECLHYPDPQTGQQQSRQPYPFSGDCAPLPSLGVSPASTTSGNALPAAGSQGPQSDYALPNSSAPAPLPWRSLALLLCAGLALGAGLLRHNRT